MLVLTRYLDGQIRIGDDIVITCLGYDTERRQFRLGFSAPKDVEIHREEVYQQLQREKVERQRTLDL
jgi:carbon storage regulator